MGWDFFWRSCQFTYNLLRIACEFYLYICKVQFAWLPTMTVHLCKYCSHVFYFTCNSASKSGSSVSETSSSLPMSLKASAAIVSIFAVPISAIWFLSFYLLIQCINHFLKFAIHYPISMPFIRYTQSENKIYIFYTLYKVSATSMSRGHTWDNIQYWRWEFIGRFLEVNCGDKIKFQVAHRGMVRRTDTQPRSGDFSGHFYWTFKPVYTVHIII